MKVALIGPTHPYRGGIAHYTTLLFQALQTRHETRFLSFSRQYPGWLFPGQTDIDPSQQALRAPEAEPLLDSMNPYTWVKTARLLRRWQADLVIIPWWVSFWAPQFLTITLLLKKNSKTKILFVCHNVIAHESNWLNRLATRMVLKQGDLFLVHSEEDRRNLLDIDARVMLRKCFLPTHEAFHRSTTLGQPAKEHDLRSQYRLHAPVLLFFGFVRPYKGLATLLKAIPAILATIPVTLLVAGEFWKDKEEYLALIEKLGITRHVVILDQYIPNEMVKDIFDTADLVVQPYLSATGSAVTQMAFGFHKPLVASAVGSLAEVIDDGRTGILVPPNDPDALAKAIIGFFTDNLGPIFVDNIRRSQRQFSWERLLQAIEELYEEVKEAEQQREKSTRPGELDQK